MNSFKVLLAKFIINSIHIPWRISEIILHRRFRLKSHYYIMVVFRKLFKKYFVRIKYKNPFSYDPKSIHLKVNLCENMQQSNFRLKGNYDYQWLKIIADGMKHADTFVDVGANIGTYAITIAQAFPEKKVVAIEPFKPNYDLLVANIKENNLTNVLPLRKAVSNRNGKIRFYINPIHDGGGSTAFKSSYTTGDVSIDTNKYLETHPKFTPFVEVETVRLDDIIKSKSILKIDVEGTELDAIMSGSNVLRSDLVELAIIEILPENVDEKLKALDSLGFECFQYGSRLPFRKDASIPKHGVDCLTLKRNTYLHNTINFN